LEDERNLNVRLTPTGKTLRQQALNIPPAIMNRLGMITAELQQLHAIPTDVIANPRPAGAAPNRRPSHAGALSVRSTVSHMLPRVGNQNGAGNAVLVSGSQSASPAS